MYDEWIKVLPSLSADIPRLCRLAIDAEVDNSNQLNEAAFRYWKYNTERQEAEQNPGTLTMHWWEQDMASNSMFINDLDHLKERVNEHNARRSKKRNEPINDAVIDAMEESRDVPWGEKKDKIDCVRDHLNLYMATYPSKCGETDKETHRILKEFFENQQPAPVPFISSQTLKKYLAHETKKPQLTDRQLDTFVLFMRDDELGVVSEGLGEINRATYEGMNHGVNAMKSPPRNVRIADVDDVGSSLGQFMDVDRDSDYKLSRTDDGLKSGPLDGVESGEIMDEDSDSDYEFSMIEDYVPLDDDAMQNEEVASPSNPRVGPVMFDNPIYGKLPERVTAYRERWNLLSEYRQIPRRVKNEVMAFAQTCLENPAYGKQWASILDTSVTRITLTDDECRGEETDEVHIDEVVRERQVLGDNISDEVLVMNSSYSMALAPNRDDPTVREILEILESSIPDSLFPVSDSNGMVDECQLRENNKYCSWLDDVRKHGRFGSENGAVDNRQPMRRTISVALSEVYDIADPIDEGERMRRVLRMFVYTCRESPAKRWMSRPSTNIEYAAVLVIWVKCWPYLPIASRQKPPTAWQYCIYQHVLNKYMGEHRDNFVRQDLKDLADPKGDGELNERGTWAGVENSQVKGSAVIVYSMGNCPMRMIFSKLSARDGAYQEKSTYEIEPTFCFQFENGWICILDPIDDLLMMHSMTFEGIKESTEGNPNEFVRVAMVIRLLQTVREFYVDTSTMRLAGKTLKQHLELDGPVDDSPSDVARGVDT
jgi:hypothetical protein